MSSEERRGARWTGSRKAGNAPGKRLSGRQQRNLINLQQPLACRTRQPTARGPSHSLNLAVEMFGHTAFALIEFVLAGAQHVLGGEVQQARHPSVVVHSFHMRSRRDARRLVSTHGALGSLRLAPQVAHEERHALDDLALKRDADAAYGADSEGRGAALVVWRAALEALVQEGEHLATAYPPQVNARRCSLCGRRRLGFEVLEGRPDGAACLQLFQVQVDREQRLDSSPTRTRFIAT